MSSEIPDALRWVFCARSFLATGERKFLDQASEACKDGAVREVLLCRELREDRQVPQELFLPVVKSLRSKGRRQEAAMVEVLGLHLLGMLASSPEQLQPDMRDYVRRVSNDLACICEDNGFTECEALYGGVLGTYLAKTHDWERAERVLAKSVRLWRQEAAAAPLWYRRRLAGTLVNLAYVLRDLRRSTEARAAIQEAVGIDRELVSSGCSGSQDDLVTSLLALGTLLRADRCLKESCAAFEEAICALRAMEAHKPGVHRSDLAIALNNLGAVLMEDGQWREAEVAYHEALESRRALAGSGEPTYRSDVATTLGNLGNLLQEQGRLDEAETAYQEALAIRRSVAASEGTGPSPRVASILRNLGLLREKQGRLNDSVAARRETVEAYRHLVKRGDIAFQADLLDALNGLAGSLFELGALGEARALREEALAICRDLQGSHPGRYESELATTVASLAMALLRERRVAESREAFRESVALYRRLADGNPIRYLPSLAKALRGLGMALHKERRIEEARQAYQESLSILRESSASEGQACQEDVADSLTSLATLMTEEENPSEANPVFEQAIGIYRRLATGKPGYGSGLALALGNFGASLFAQRRFAEARTICQEALKVYGDLPKSSEPSVLNDIARTWINLGAVFEGDGQIDESCHAFEQALTTYRRLDMLCPAIFHPELSQVLNNLGVLGAKAGRFAEAAVFHREALAIRRSLAASAPETHARDLSQTLHNLGNVLLSAGQVEEALEAFGEATRIRQNLIGPPQAHRAELAGTLSSISCLLEATGNAAQAAEKAEEAIRVAEGGQDSPSETWLAKGPAIGAYHLYLSAVAGTEDSDRLFRCVSALREGQVLALGKDKDQSLMSARRALARAEKRLGTSVVILVAETLADGKSLLGVLGSCAGGFCTTVDDRFPPLSKRLFEGIETIFSEPISDPTARNRAVESLASEAWEALPPFVQAALAPQSGSTVMVSGDSYWAAFPWEALRFDTGDRDWLGLHQCLPRWGPLAAGAIDRVGRSPFGRGAMTAAVVAPWDTDPQRMLRRTEREARRNETALQEMGYKLRPYGKAFMGRQATEQAMDQILAAPPSVIHFTGHGSIYGNEEVLVLWDHRRPNSVFHYGRMQLALLKKGLGRKGQNLLQDGPLVVLNSCWSGRTRNFGGQREDLSWSFLQEGAEAVVASPLPVHDPVGEVFGSAIYDRRLVSRHGIGRTILDARLRLADTVCRENPVIWPAWMLITCHGNPFAYLPHLKSNLL